MLINTLQTVGVRKEQRLLDFGCGTGDYSIPAAQIVGDKGFVYAVDSDETSLQILRNSAHVLHIHNLRIINTYGMLELPIESNSIDFVLLYDVLHSYYFTEIKRKELFEEVSRISHQKTIISVYPKHIDHRIIIREMNESRMVLAGKFLMDILHYHSYEKDYLFNFRLS